MADLLFPTPNRLRILRHVEAGLVRQHMDLLQPFVRDHADYNRVTAVITEMERAGWVYIDESDPIGDRPVYLSALGRAVLDGAS